MLKVSLLSDSAKPPTLAHPGEDLGYDLYASDSGWIPPGEYHVFHTGIAVEFVFESEPELKFGFLIKERSSLAVNGISVLGGVVDSGYRGEIHLVLANHGNTDYPVVAGAKIANLIPIPVVANKVEVVANLTPSLRGDGAFGSTGA